MSDTSGAVATSEVVILEEREGSGAVGGRAQAEAPGRPAGWRRAGCGVWPRQQTWLCAVPLLIGFVGLGLSLMLLKWIVVGSVRDYVPTDLVDAKGIGQDPIFLSKPSAFPKGGDTTTTTTTTSPSGPGGTGFTTAVRGKARTGAPPNTSPRGAGASGSQVTQKSPTQRSGPRGPASGGTTTAFSADSAGRASTSSPSPSNPTVLNDSTQTWTREQSSTERPSTTPARTHAHRKTPAPTLPPLKSEHFKPCQEKDLAYCLNDGECFVIETLSGPHKHCRCKEGFQGIRCDQFLPKTDSILSDPTDHLGIEFMESKEVYKRQVLSITCIAMGISFLGTLCVALYCRSKRRREKLQAHLKESRFMKTSVPPCRPAPRPRSGLQPQSGKHFCKSTRSSTPHGGAVHESSFTQSTAASSIHLKGVSIGRHHRSGSLPHSADQRNHSALRLAARRTPPIPKGKLNPIGGARDSGPAYQHLQEVEGSERDAEPIRLDWGKPGGELHHDSSYDMQGSYSSVRRGAQLEQHFSGSPRERFLAPYRPGSIPIIPSVHSSPDEASCMQTAALGVAGQATMSLGSSEDSPSVWPRPSRPLPDRAAGKQKDATRERHGVLGHAQKKQEDSGFPAPLGARETVCILLASGAGLGGVASSGPTETQLVNPRDTHKDCAQSSQ